MPDFSEFSELAYNELARTEIALDAPGSAQPPQPPQPPPTVGPAHWRTSGEADVRWSGARKQASYWRARGQAGALFAPARRAESAWSAAGQSTAVWDVGGNSQLWFSTLISQYANSPTLIRLVRDMDAWINPRTDFDAFFNMIWNVETAQGVGLDIWGRIVGVSRAIRYTAPAPTDFLGFRGGVGHPLNQAPFRSGQGDLTKTLTLRDDAYRTLIMVKAMANISACTAPSINQLLSNLFAGRGRCYVQDLGQMMMNYVFEFELAPHEVAIVTQSGVFPHPAAVEARAITIPTEASFGFKGTGLQPFNQGAFFSTNQVHHATQ